MKDQGFKLGFGLLSLPFGVLIHGYVLAKLWTLFISSTFNFTEISPLHAAGIMLVIDFIIMKIDWTNHEEEADFKEYFTKTFAHLFVTPFVVLGIGYILNYFM